MDHEPQPSPAPAELSPAGASPPAGLWRRVAATVKRLGPAGPLAVMASTLPGVGGFVVLGLAGYIAPWMRAHFGLALLAYVSGFTMLAALSLLPTYACSMLGGWVFGFGIGLPAAITSFCTASLVAYWVNSRAAGDRVLTILQEHPRWEAVRKALIGCGFFKSLAIITLVRIPPSSPFALTNFIMSTTRAPLIPFLLGTAIGMTPRTAVVVWAAAHASTLDFNDSGQTWLYIAGLVVTIGVVAVICVIANRAVHQITKG